METCHFFSCLPNETCAKWFMEALCWDLKWGTVEKYKSCIVEVKTLSRLNEVEASHL